MDEKVRIINAEIRVRGDAKLELRSGASPALWSIMIVGWLAGAAGIGYGVAVNERWPFPFAMFMFWISAVGHMIAWRAAAHRLGYALMVATDNGRVLRPVRMREKRDAVGAAN